MTDERPEATNGARETGGERETTRGSEDEEDFVDGLVNLSGDERAEPTVDESSNGDAADPEGFYANGDAADLLGDGEESSADGSTANDGTANGQATNGEVTNGESAPADERTNGHDDALSDVDVPGETDDDEVEPVELLVQLAREGEIEPWDIDIVEVTDAFLDRLDATDLRTSGRALFYASVLLRMKSDELLAPDEPEEPEPEPWEAAFDEGAGQAVEGGGYDPVDALEAEMDRRLERKHARGSPETLEELVHELRDAERGSWWKRSRTYDTSDSPQGYQRGTQTLDYHSPDDMRAAGEPGEEDVTGTTHNEDIERVIDEVRGVLREQYDRGRTEVLFEELADAGGSRVMSYLALLFLAHRSDVRLQQDDLFGDLWVQDPAATTGEEVTASAAD